jgi:hypothetical protein
MWIGEAMKGEDPKWLRGRMKLRFEDERIPPYH